MLSFGLNYLLAHDLPFYNLFTLKLNHGQTIWDKKMVCYLEHLGNTSGTKKHSHPLEMIGL
jgi:hypothetical protein